LWILLPTRRDSVGDKIKEILVDHFGNIAAPLTEENKKYVDTASHYEKEP
jgi:hypothetical protein